jgi:Skp family chaperone for outer membrane proteins
LADLKNLDSLPEWLKEERRKQDLVATNRFNKASQEREAQKQIRRNQANARLAALRAIINGCAQAP